jgi:anti-sigma B factor antagonist
VTGDVRVVVRQGEDHTVISPQGSLYFDTYGPLRDALLSTASEERPHVVLDLSRAPMCDSSTLNLMVQARQLAVRRGGWLRLARVQPQVRRILDITNLVRILDIYDTVDAATP